MKRKSNWLKNLLQWGTLAAIVGFVVYGLTLGEKPADVEAYCPFGGLQALGSYLVNNSLACTMSMTQIMVGVMLSANSSAATYARWEPSANGWAGAAKN